MHRISSLFSVTGGCHVYLLFHGGMTVIVDFVVETFNMFVLSLVSSVCMHSCRCVAAVSKLGCCEKTVISSA